MHVRYFFLPRLVSLDQSNCSKFMSIQILKNTLHGKTFAENQFNTVITARKRSCRKIMFLHLSATLFTGEGSLSSGGVGVGSVQPRGLCPAGGVSVQQGGLCLGGSLSGRPPYGKERAVRILLECVLVVENVPIKV